MLQRNGVGVEIVSKHPVFTEGKQMSGCCLKDGIMYKPGATFYDAATDTTLVCCSGSIYAQTDNTPPMVHHLLLFSNIQPSCPRQRPPPPQRRVPWPVPPTAVGQRKDSSAK